MGVVLQTKKDFKISFLNLKNKLKKTYLEKELSFLEGMDFLVELLPNYSNKYIELT